jgi:hypothetical protein
MSGIGGLPLPRPPQRKTDVSVFAAMLNKTPEKV